MTIKVAINGFGRIGRNILRAFGESKTKHDLQFVAINDLGDAKTNAHLLKYDTAHGRFRGTVEVSGNSMQVNGQGIQVVAERDPSKLPWKALGIDRFGESAPAADLFKHFGFTPENVAKAVRSVVP